MSTRPLMIPDQETEVYKPNSKKSPLYFRLVLIALILAVVIPCYISLIELGQIKNTLNKHTEELNLLKTYIKDLFPNVYSVPYVNPVKNQGGRGTCWDFGSIAVLENAYRKQGIENGWLQPSQYIQFSEQAYGNRILHHCSHNPKPCTIGGDQVAFNSTNGGEITLLYYFRNEFKREILPHAVCPYISRQDNSSCPGIKEALASNPISFSINGYSTFYNIEKIKRALVDGGHPLGWSSLLMSATFYHQCNNDTKSSPLCNPETCEHCPRFSSACCIKFTESKAWTGDGNFFSHEDMRQVGGHVMTIVGFNDNFVTRYNRVGGWILKNSWSADQGHSIAYWKQEISDGIERLICPNSLYPLNWYQCGGRYVAEKNVSMAVKECRSDATQQMADNGLQPLHLKCLNEDYGCSKEFEYFTTSLDQVANELHKFCVLEVHNDISESQLKCFGPLYLDIMAKIFAPSVPSEIRQNDPDYCGFYFFPYDLQTELLNRFSMNSFFASDFHFKFSDSSYYANQDSRYQYSLLKDSTHEQAPLKKYVDPYPNIYEK